MSTNAEKPIRASMGFKKEVAPVLREAYGSSLIEWMKSHGFRLSVERLNFYLAEEFGFCYGVDRAVQLAYETRKRFPDKRIFLTSEIIHNPQVNAKLRESGIQFLDDSSWRSKGLDAVSKEDIAIIPAFGATHNDWRKLSEKGCVLVDTTCGSVVHVWKRVEQYARDGFTAIVHGKYNHEETRATCSRAAAIAGGKYLVVRDLEETRHVCEFIRGKIDSAALLARFAPEACSQGFNPAADLVRVGCANQTTMLSDESIRIADAIYGVMKERYSEAALAEHFRHFDTICTATQERQDAVAKLVKENLDCMLVIGGYNSSNTAHLVEIASQHCASYHIQDASDVVSASAIRHKLPNHSEPELKQGWLKEGQVKIGVTAGASTPDRSIEEVIRRVIEVFGFRAPDFR